MSGDHADLIAELRALTHLALERLEPMLDRAAEAAANAADPADGEPGPYGCAWCPVCALAALARGEQHDLVTMLASQASVLLALVRALLDEHGSHPGPGDDGPGGAGPGGAPTDRPRAFVPITVQVEENP
ncbi:hypothetical protein FK531_08815 [Rhodococcus spelaei]|uniref:Uncharacterized protein n=1 Tax=Rhodococcus spelaei TaxID=2546320 RepID=A0A541BMM9_9NOCA|nr:hypothetical protein [Rhodococcus spelaei]TQF73572.1 hypothetical protein FK531_08815 [Rhodococcus spelaei]